MNISLVRDFAQLPPVGNRPLYAPPSTDITDNGALSRNGSCLYQAFSESYLLRVVHRQTGDSPAQQAFHSLLQHASQGSLSVEEWKTLQTRCANALPLAEKNSFDNAICQYTTREEVHAVNLQEIQSINEPCARISAKHDGRASVRKVVEFGLHTLLSILLGKHSGRKR
ncbi:hypothetical protein R3P38DRAFT_2505290 [Favolaschia claudopus]|uniref:OTU domain-containing protein n=1 Tax=Favolaschia claudopus TaxID=2862362 RepID=A0AAW0DC45_9AGAR